MVEISGHGILPVENHAVCIWLDICEEPNDLVAEGSIHGSEELMPQSHEGKAGHT
jgi:pyrroloquinoline quinone (PQQ) biosynthesis protein C